jgi:hypothetical protein
VGEGRSSEVEQPQHSGGTTRDSAAPNAVSLKAALSRPGQTTRPIPVRAQRHDGSAVAPQHHSTQGAGGYGTTRKEAKMKSGEQPTEWDPDMDDLLLRLDGRQMSYRSIANAMSVVLGFEISMSVARHRLLTLRGPSPLKARGVPFGSQARELICR